MKSITIATTVLLALGLFSVKATASVDPTMDNVMIAQTIPDAEYTEENALHDLDLLILRIEESSVKLKEAAAAIDKLQTIISNKENCND